MEQALTADIRATDKPTGASRLWLASIAIMVFGALIYAPALTGPAIWDDHDLLNGVGLGNPHTIWDCFRKPFLFYYFRPLTSMSFFLERSLTDNPFLFHQTNLILHVLAIGAFIGLMQAIFRNGRTAALGGLLYAAQPAQVSTTAWIGGRTDLSAEVMVLMFAWTLVLSTRSNGAARMKLSLASVCFYLLALSAKEQSLLFILLVPLAYLCFSEKDAGNSKAFAFKAMIPYVIAAGIFLVAWKFLGPTPQKLKSDSFLLQLGTVGQSISYYTLLLLLPTTRWLHTVTLGSLNNAAFSVFGWGIAGMAIWLFRRLFRQAPGASWLLAFAGLGIVPVLNVIPLSSLTVAPYRAGLAGIGIAGLLAWIAAAALEKIGKPEAFPAKLWMALGVAYAAWCIGLTAWAVLPWRDELAISRLVLANCPESLFARLEVGNALLSAGKLDESLVAMRNTVKLAPDALALASQSPLSTAPFVVNLNVGDNAAWIARTYAKLGLALLNEGKIAEATEALRTAQAVLPKNEMVNIGLANLAYKTGDWKSTVACLRIALQSAPWMTDKHMALGQILVQHGQFSEAAGEFQTVMAQNPGNSAGYVALAETQERMGDRASAKSTLELAANRRVISMDEKNGRIAQLHLLRAP